MLPVRLISASKFKKDNLWGFCPFVFVFQNRDKLEKLKNQAETFCQRLGRYRMPFAWATVNIMDVISTATLDRDVTDSESIKGGAYEFFLEIRKEASL